MIGQGDVRPMGTRLRNGTSETGLKPMCSHQRLRLVIFQEEPGVWIVRGLEHDLIAEARSIGEAVRAVVRLVDAHAGFDARRDLVPLAAFRPAPQNYWNAFSAGTPVSLAQLGVTPPARWEISLALARYRPLEERPRSPMHA